jgi:hypothetical protein
LDITKIDLTTKDFAGEFRITFIKDTSFNANPFLPDTVFFTQGNFQTKIQEK